MDYINETTILAFIPKATNMFCKMAGLLTYSLFVAFPSAILLTVARGWQTNLMRAYSSGNCCRFSRHSLLIQHSGMELRNHCKCKCIKNICLS